MNAFLRNYRLWLDRSFKALVLMGLLYVLHREIGGRDQLLPLWHALLQQLKGEGRWWLLPALLLMPVNWGLESEKWRRLLRGFWRVAPWPAFRAVAAGITLSLFTPNRVGDYGGRVLAVPAAHNWQAVMATMAGNMAQLIALLSGGLAGTLYYLQTQASLPQLLISSFWWLLVVGLLLVYIFYFNLNWLASWIQLLPLPKKWRERIAHLGQFNRRQLGAALLLAFARYGVYCLQYLLLTRFFGIDAPALAGLSGIAAIFLFQVTVPLPPVAALLARGEAALIIWGPFTDNELSILAATFGLFILNLAFPALLGMAFIVKINVLKSLGYETNAPENERNSLSPSPAARQHGPRADEPGASRHGT